MSLDTYLEKLLVTFSGQVLQHLSQGRLKRSIFVSSVLKVFPAFCKKNINLSHLDSNPEPLDYGTNAQSPRLCNQCYKEVKIGRLISYVRRFFILDPQLGPFLVYFKGHFQQSQPLLKPKGEFKGRKSDQSDVRLVGFIQLLLLLPEKNGQICRNQKKLDQTEKYSLDILYNNMVLTGAFLVENG